jgi:hypothetical protein
MKVIRNNGSAGYRLVDSSKAGMNLYRQHCSAIFSFYRRAQNVAAKINILHAKWQSRR